MRKTVILGTVVLCQTSWTAAHPGHGCHGGSHGLWHYLSEPTHLVMIGAVLVPVVVGIHWLRRIAGHSSRTRHDMQA